MGKINAAAFLTMWVAIAALSCVVARELGWARLRHYWVTLTVLLLALVALPGAAVYKVTQPYLAKILARLIPHHSPAIALGAGCSVLPDNNIWNVPVQKLPLDPRSGVYIQSMEPASPVHADFAMPYTVVEGSEPAQVSFASGESDQGAYPVPDGAPVEAGDQHVIVLDRAACRLYELYAAQRSAHLVWQAGSGAIFDLRSNQLRPAGWTSADGAGLPIFPGLIRWEEVRTGEIRHALRFTTRHTRREFVWPARHFASSSTDANLPPMGQRFRLRASFDLSGLCPEAQVILTALKEYGMVLADNGGPWYVTGAPDSNFTSRVLIDLKTAKGSDFEAVDTSSLMIAPDSGEARR